MASEFGGRSPPRAADATPLRNGEARRLRCPTLRPGGDSSFPSRGGVATGTCSCTPRAYSNGLLDDDERRSDEASQRRLEHLRQKVDQACAQPLEERHGRYPCRQGPCRRGDQIDRYIVRRFCGTRSAPLMHGAIMSCVLHGPLAPGLRFVHNCVGPKIGRSGWRRRSSAKAAPVPRPMRFSCEQYSLATHVQK